MNRTPARLGLALLATTVCALVATPFSSAASRSVPQGFAGIHFPDFKSLDAAGVDIGSEIADAAANGVETIRFPVYWSNIQPYSTWEAVPEARRNVDCVPDPGGDAPWCLRVLTATVTGAANTGIKLVPILLGAPRWAADPTYPTSPSGLTMPIPASFDRFAAFARGLAERYGTAGSLLPAGKTSPISAWQIWNEPNFHQYWPQHETECVSSSNPTAVPSPCPTVTIKNLKNQSVNINAGELDDSARALLNDPADTSHSLWARLDSALATKRVTRLFFAPTYVDLVRRTRSAIRSVNPSAKIMLSSVANGDFSVRPNRLPRAVDLDFIYKAGGKGTFDVAAANIFTGTVTQIALRIGDYRAAMKSGGNSTLPLAITEFSWANNMGLPTSVFRPGQLSLAVSSTQQGTNLGSALDMFVRYRTKYVLWGAYWHTWATGYSTSVDGAGLVDLWDLTGLKKLTGSTLTPQPALAKYKAKALYLEGRCKTKVVATRCAS